MTESWMLRVLATETRRHHPAADGARLAIMENASSLRYRCRLMQVFGFEAPVEAWLRNTPHFDRRLLVSHMKTDRLANDLRALGVRCEIPDESIPAFEDVGQALGWLYVVHRNTLFHGLLWRQLGATIAADVRVAGSYLRAFEGQVGRQMRELGIVLDRTATRCAIAERIVAGAHEAFRCQHRWYEGEPARRQLFVRDAA